MNKIIIILLLSLLVGCKSYGSFQSNVCHSPFSKNISCIESRSCLTIEDQHIQDINKIYQEFECEGEKK